MAISTLPLVDNSLPKFKLEANGQVDVYRTEVKKGVTYHHVHVSDPLSEEYIEKEGGGRQARAIAEVERLGELAKKDPDEARRQLFTTAALQKFADEVPNASGFALDPLYRPDLYSFVQATGEVDAVAKEWFTLCPDAVAIRKRGVLARALCLEHVNRTANQNGVAMLSLACGAMRPMVGLAGDLVAEGHQDIRLDALDRSGSVLRDLARPIAQDAGIDVQERREGVKDDRNVNPGLTMNTIRGDVRDTKGVLPRDMYDVADAIGIFEYLPEWQKVGSLPPLPVYWAQALVSNAYRHLKEGGILVFGNMLASRPYRDFLEHVVGWPYLQMRDPEEVVRILTKQPAMNPLVNNPATAKLLGKLKPFADTYPNICPEDVTVYLPDDGNGKSIYALYVIRKSKH